MKPLALLFVWALAVGWQPAWAQEGTVSYSLWSLTGNTVILRFLLPVADAQRVAGTDIEVLTQSRFGDYLLDHVAVRAGAQNCTAIDQGYDIGKVDPLTVAAGLYGFEIFFRCPAPAPLPFAEQPLANQSSSVQSEGVVLHDAALFGRLPGQVNFARVQINSSPFVQQVFTAHHQELRLPDSGAPQPAGMSRYLSLGVAHILGNLDRLCFIVGALLLARRLRPAAWLVGGLAGGYALSVPIALLAPIAPRARLLDAFIGFLITLLAAQLVTRQLGRATLAALAAGGLLLWLAAAALIAHAGWPALLLVGAALFAAGLLESTRHQTAQPLGLWLLPAVFGFLDGFVLPSSTNPLDLTAGTLAPILISFDLGAWAIGALLVLSLLSLAAVWRQPHGLRSSTLGLGTDLSAAALAGLGAFWMVSRLHG